METNEMPGVAYNGVIRINSDKYPNLAQLTPKELCYLPTGAKGDKPSFAIIMSHGGRSAIGEFSLETLRGALNDVGYDISEKISEGKQHSPAAHTTPP